MSERPVFGVTLPPKEDGVRMAYIARRPLCGHIVIAQADTRRESLQEFVSYIVLGMNVERVPSEQVRDEGFCDCPKPEQTVMDFGG